MGETMMDTFTVKIRASERAWALGVAEHHAEQYFGHPGTVLFTCHARYLSSTHALDPRYEYTFTFRGNIHKPNRLGKTVNYPQSVRPCIYCGEELWEDQFHDFVDGEGVGACGKMPTGNRHVPEGLK